MATMSDAAIEYLRRLGESGSGPHDIAHAALMLAALDHRALPLEPYLGHLRQIEEAMQAEAALFRRVDDGVRALVRLLVNRLGYDGDRLEYDNPGNADLISVIDRRRGLPVALGVLYMHAARAGGMRADGLNSPTHFVLRLSHRGDDAIVDPFNGGMTVERERVAVAPGAGDAGLAQPVSDTDVLLRLENNLKMRALNAGEHERALELTRRMVLIAPRRSDLWFDLARLNEAVGVLGAARKAYETCLELAQPDEGFLNEAAISLSQLKRRLN
jgi:regulator of sirC expression with transglutaminase-like and TPR domain